MLTSEECLERVKQGLLITSMTEASVEYQELLTELLLVIADSELLSAYTMARALTGAPSIRAQQSGLKIVEDEVRHAYVGYQLLADLGENVRELLYKRPWQAFRNHYLFGVEFTSWAEFIACNILSDRAGYVTLRYLHESGSYLPLRQALAGVNAEERFHVKHGEHWVEQMQNDPQALAVLQVAVDWIFPACVEYFWAPTTKQQDSRISDYRLMAPLPALLQEWLSAVVPFCEQHGLVVPAHLDATRASYQLDFTPPIKFDSATKRWFPDQPLSETQALARRATGGPAKQAFVTAMRSAGMELRRLQQRGSS